MRSGRVTLAAAGAVLVAVSFAWAHPAVEGGIKHGFAWVKGFAGSHIELVVDSKAGQIRLYVSEAEDEKLADGKKHEWVIPMSVRAKKVGAEDVSLLPMRDPGAAGEWFPVTPVEKKNGFVLYRIEAVAKVMLDGDPSKRQTLTFAAGIDPRGTCALVASLDLSNAQTIRFEEVKVSIVDAAKARPAWEKACFVDGWGLGSLQKGIPQKDYALKTFAEFLAKSGDMDKFRKPQAPAIPAGKASPSRK